MPQRFVYTAIVSVLALAVPAAATGGSQALTAVVGPAHNISLTNAGGSRVTQLDPGTYTIRVSDQSSEHNFSLTGPGVNQSTDVEFVGEVTWTVTVRDGRYTYICQVHPTTMRGSFHVGAAPAPSRPAVKKLAASVSATRIVLRLGATRIRTLKAGTYDIVVRDTSRRDNFHLVGPGVNRRTGLAFTGSVTWRVKLAKGKVYRYRSDRNAKLRGSIRAT